MRKRNSATIVDDDSVEEIRRLKGLPADRKKILAIHLSNAYSRVYRAVALDIDGTYVDKEHELSDDLLSIVVSLLGKGVPVIFFTGRGKKESHKIGQLIRQYALGARVDEWYLRRLQFVVRNGECRIYTRTSEHLRFLEREEALVENLANKIVIRDKLFDLIHRLDLKPERKDYAVRLLDLDRNGLEKHAEILDYCVSENVHILYSQYGTTPVIDFCFTHKGLALEKMADRLGLRIEELLCIGDQGDEGGNDFEFLRRDNGFSVGAFSKNEDGCFPVLDSCNTRQLGPLGTSVLLRNVLVVPPVSLSGEFFTIRRAKLAGFERFARRQGLETKRSMTNEIRAKYRSIVPTGERFFSSHTLELSDFFDEFSGAIRLRDWELEDLLNIDSVDKLYGINNVWLGRSLDTHRTLDSDTGIILRGKDYYWSLSRPEERNLTNLPAFIESVLNYLKDAGSVVDDVTFFSPTLPKFKVILSIFDNIRNAMLIVLYAHWLEFKEGAQNKSTLVDCYDIIKSNAKEFARILLDQTRPWGQSLSQLKVLIKNTTTYLRSYQQSWSPIKPEVELFKYRECDYFLEAYVATRNAILDFERHGCFPSQKVQVLGVAYGGIELPILADVICDFAGIECIPLFGKWSLYSEKEIEKGELGDYYRHVQENAENLQIMGVSNLQNDVPILIADDNCTTCKTIQHVRDTLVYKCLEVVGAIAVRYPGTNRVYHMAQANHGFPDPENMFSFVRGLVSPSPYSRLSHDDLSEMAVGPKYKDKLDIFDKSKHRITNLLVKNSISEEGVQ